MKEILKQVEWWLEETAISLAAWENIFNEQRVPAPGKLRPAHLPGGKLWTLGPRRKAPATPPYRSGREESQSGVPRALRKWVDGYSVQGLP